jgi:PBP1b-binding outer membrane lipoprotein LpoB
MKKNLLVLSLFILTIALASCRGRSQQPTQIVEENIEYRPLVTDSAAIDSINNSGMVDNDAILEMPDIPKDKDIDMNANDAEVMDIMSGTGDGDIMKESDPTR